MSININTKFGEIVTSQAINEKVATIFGGNALIKGFDVTVKDNIVLISPGECCICGASIEETDEKTLELKDLLLLNKNIVVVLSYNHKEYDFSYRLALESSVSDNELVIATLIVENSLIKNIVDVEKVATLIELNEIERTISENVSSAQHLEYQGKNLTCVETSSSKTENISIKGDSKKLGDNISSVGSYGNTLKIKSCGKNLANPSMVYDSDKLNDSKFQLTDGSVDNCIFKVTSTSTDNVNAFALGLTVNVKPGARYSISYRIDSKPSDCLYVYKGKNNLWDPKNAITIVNNSFVVPDDTNFITAGMAYMNVKNNYNKEIVIDEIQIEENNLATEYEAYQEHIVEIPLPMEGGLKALPSGVCDEITKDGDIIQRVDRVIFNGSENWNLLRDDSLVTFYLDFDETTSDNNQEVISNRLASFGFNQSIENIYCDNKRVYITIEKGIAANNNVAGFKLWLGENNIEMLFEIDHAGDVRVENINIHTFKGVNSITTNCSVKPVISLNNQDGECLTFNRSEDSFTDSLKIKGNSIGGIRDENIILDKVELPVFNGTTNIIQNNKITGDISFKVDSENKTGNGNIKIENAKNSKTSNISIKGKTLYKQTHCKFEEGFNVKFDDKYPAQAPEIMQEIREANSDYFGKEHPTLKAKENSEFEFVHIDNSKGMFMPVNSNDGGIKVKNSIEGKTKDLTVKGRTLQNLSNYKIMKFNKPIDSVYYFRELTMDLLKKDTTYTMVLDITKNPNIVNSKLIFLFIKDGAVGGVTNKYYTSETGRVAFAMKTKNEEFPNGVKFRFACSEGGTVGDYEIDNLMILEGDHTANPPTEYFEGIKSVGEEESKISILSTNKNLLDSKNTKMGTIDTTTGTPNEWPNNFSSKEFMTIKSDLVISRSNLGKNKTLGIFKYSDDKSYLGVQWVSASSNSAVIKKDNAALIKIGGSIVGGDEVEGLTFENAIEKLQIQIEEGTITTPYIPHQSDKKDILLPSTVTHGSKSLPSGVCDEVYANGDCLQRIGIGESNPNYVVDRWSHEVEINTIGFAISHVLKNNIPTQSSHLNMHCNVLPVVSRASLPTLDIEGVCNSRTDEKLLIKILRTRLATQDIKGFKKWLQANPVTVYYELSEPILHKATQPINHNLTTFNDTTHISTTNKIQGVISGFRPVPVTYTDSFDANFISEIESVGDNEGNVLSVKSTGKNIAFKNTVIINKDENTGRKINVFDGFLKKDTIIYIQAKKTTDTDRMCKCVLTDFNGKEVYPNVNNRYRASTDFKTIDIYVDAVDYVNGKAYSYFDIQIEEGTLATQYETHKENRKNIILPVQNGAKSLLNNIVCDEQYANGDFLQKIKRYEITGNESWSMFTTSGDQKGRMFNVRLESIGIERCKTARCMSNNFPYDPSAWTTGSNSTYMGTSAQDIRIRPTLTQVPTQDVGGFKKWLRENPTVVYYELETPILHKATSESIEDTKINLPSQFSHFSLIDSASKKENGAISLSNTGSSKDEIKLLSAPSDGLKSVNSNLSDEILTDGSINKNVETVVFNGTEEWINEDVTGEFKVFFTQINKATNNYIDVVLCDRFPSSGYVKHKENIFVDNKRIYIVIHQSKLVSSDIAGFKAWLASNNTEVLFRYDKTESIREENLNLHTFSGVTRISQNSDVSGNIVAQVPLSNGEYQNISSDNITINNCVAGITNNLKVVGKTRYKQTHCKFEEGFNVKVPNSIVGSTKNLAVKGRTLQNLINSSADEIVLIPGNSYQCDLSYTLKDACKYTFYIYIKESIEVHGDIRLVRGESFGTHHFIPAGVSGWYKYTTVTNSLGAFEWGRIQSNIYNFSKTKSYTISKWMIVEGENNLDEYFSGIKSLGEEENKISILSNGKNLIKINNVSFDKSKNTGHSILTNVKLKKGLNYCFTGTNVRGTIQFRFTRGDGTQAFRLINTQAMKADSDFIKVEIVTSYAEYIDGIITGANNIQIEEGTSATIYEGHKQDKKDIPLPVSNGCKGLSDNVTDEVLSNGDYLQRINKVIFTGNETVRRHGVYGDVTRFDIEIADIKNSFNPPLISNIFPTGIISTPNLECISVHVESKVFQVQVKTSRIDTVEAFKTFLTGKELIYELAQPILHKATQPTNHNLATFKNVTHITTTDRVQGVVSGYSPIPATYTDSFDSNFINELESIGDSTENKVNILSTGKNLYPHNSSGLVNVATSSWHFLDGKYQAYGDMSNKTNLKFYLKAGVYYISGKSTADISIVEIEEKYMNTINRVMTIPLDSWYTFRYYNTPNVTFEFSDIQIEKGSEVTPYNFYQQDNKNISIPVQNGLKGIPGGACDEILSNGDYLQRTESITLDGTEKGWTLLGENSRFIESPRIKNAKGNSNLICNKLIKAFIGFSSINNPVAIFLTYDLKIRIKPFEKHDMTLQEGLDWLKENHATVCYELAEPILHKNPNNTELSKESYEVV